MQRVAVAGITGTLAPSVINYLLIANLPVTLLTRDLSRTPTTYQSNANIRFAKADYTSASTLASSLLGHDTVISLLSRDQLTAQLTLIDAAILAGVKHIIPSAFGLDTRIPANRDLPNFAVKVQVEHYLVRCAQEAKISFTVIQTGALFEWALSKGVLVNTKGPTRVFDGGNTEFSVSGLDDVGKAVTTVVLRMRESHFEDGNVKNQALLMHSAVLTQNQLLEMCKEARPENATKWETVDVDTKALYDRSRAAYDGGARDMPTFMGMLPRNTFGLGVGLHRPNNNGMLGIEEWDDAIVRTKIEACLRSSELV